jgi:hypothetical protein
MIDLPQDQLDQARAIVRRHVHGGEVFAVGSRVNARAKKFSDLDLMIKVDGIVPWHEDRQRMPSAPISPNVNSTKVGNTVSRNPRPRLVGSAT